MTCIVGLLDKGKVYMGADSASGDVGRYTVASVANCKVHIKDNFIIGFTTSWRMGELLRYKLKIPVHRRNIDTFEYMATSFIEAVRKCLKDGGWAKKKDEKEEGGTFLVGYKNRLFRIEGEYQIEEDILPYSAVGCGEYYAQGALFANGHLEPRERIIQALEAAEQFSAYVRRPFVIKKLG